MLRFLFAVFRKIFRAAINDAISLLTVIPHGGSCRCEPCPLTSRKPGQVPAIPLLSTRWRQIQSVLIENYDEARRSRKLGEKRPGQVKARLTRQRTKKGGGMVCQYTKLLRS